MSVEDFVKILDDEVSMNIIYSCRTPKTTAEIIDEIYAFLDERYKHLYDRAKVTRIVGPRLADLETKKALMFAEGKWKTSRYALDTLSKYFAL